MILVDEYIALRAIVARPPAVLVGETLPLTYSRTYRLMRALLDPGLSRLKVRLGILRGLSPTAMR